MEERNSSFSVKTPYGVLALAIITYLALVVLVGAFLQILDPAGEGGLAYATSALLFAGVALASTLFFKANKRDFTANEKRMLLFSIGGVNAAFYMLVLALADTNFLSLEHMAPNFLSFGLDIAVLFVTVRYFWRVHQLDA